MSEGCEIAHPTLRDANCSGVEQLSAIFEKWLDLSAVCRNIKKNFINRYGNGEQRLLETEGFIQVKVIMGKALVIVESPAKAKTINKYLGNDYVVKSSVGHIRDLPTSGSASKKGAASAENKAKPKVKK